MIATIIRSISAILLLHLLTRLSGPKQISQLSFYDYVIGITIGSTAAVMAIDNQIPWYISATSMIIFIIIELIFSYITTKSIKMRKILGGTPCILIFHGKIIEENLNKIHFDINDLLTQCRIAGYFDISKIAFAIMETNGHVSFMLKSEENPATIKDIGHHKIQEELMANVIIDGKIMTNNLMSIGKNENWLLEQLKNKNIKNTDNIILAIANHNNDLHVFTKESINSEHYFI